MSQRELGKQVRRVDALNVYAMQAVANAQPKAILESAIDMLYSIFPFQRGLALVSNEDGSLTPTVARAVQGREGESHRGLRILHRSPIVIPVPEEAVLGTPDDLRAEDAASGRLLDTVAEAYGGDDGAVGGEPAFVIVLPVHGPRAPHRSVIVLTRPASPLSFHDQLPTTDDRPFLNLVGQTVGVALTNALLVTSLKHSYSELERAQRELVARERLAAIGELAAVVAHEVRNPLGVIYNSVAALGRIAKPEAEVEPLLDIVREEASRVNRTVADLLEFARPSILAKTEQQLSLIAEDAVASARADARSRGVFVLLDADADTRAVVDGHLLRRALLNLIDNATQASREGDTVEVRVRRRDGHALIEVEDGGSGISEEARGRIFEPFFTTKSVGTGLGLAVVKRFADSHNGEVLIRSSPHAGSCFTIRLEAITA
jgi:signal transduction histidine kinase